MKQEKIKVKDLILDVNNPRVHDKTNIDVIEQSLEEFGGMRSIVIDEDNAILAGNGTVKAANNTGIDNVVIVDVPENSIIAVRKRGLTEEQKKRYKVIDNASTDLSDWDDNILLSEYDKDFLDTLNIDIPELDYSEIAEMNKRRNYKPSKLFTDVDYLSGGLDPLYAYYGGKIKVVKDVWLRFGAPQIYIEPFFGGGAIYLGRPKECFHEKENIEIINDKDCLIANFWRSIQKDPDRVVEYSYEPTIQVNIIAANKYIRDNLVSLSEKMENDKEYYDVKLAGYWLLCMNTFLYNNNVARATRPTINYIAGGIVSKYNNKDNMNAVLAEYSKRIENTRIINDDFMRGVNISVSKKCTEKRDGTAVFLDPPYLPGERDTDLYRVEDLSVAKICEEYAKEYGGSIRIALCGYEGHYDFPDTWEKYQWTAQGAYVGMPDNKQSNENRYKEVIWFSPACIKPEDFTQSEGGENEL